VDQTEPRVSAHDVRALRAAGIIPASRFAGAIGAVRDEEFWSRWGLRALLVLGAGQFLAGVVFFFAYNWNDLSEVAKFAIVEGALAIAVVAAILAGIDRTFGQTLLVAASVLTGVLLAVIGQTYQTGADAVDLFIAWAALILPWTIVLRRAVHWLLWLVVAETALALYGGQVLMAVDAVTWDEVWVMVGVTLAAALALREFVVQRGLAWLAAHWTRLGLLFAMLGALFVPAADYVVDGRDVGSGVMCVLAFAAAIIGTVAVYWRVWPDFAALVMAIGFADLFFIGIGYRVIDEAIGFSFTDQVPALTSFGGMILWAIVGTGSAAYAMRSLRSIMRRAAA